MTDVELRKLFQVFLSRGYREQLDTKRTGTCADYYVDQKRYLVLLNNLSNERLFDHEGQNVLAQIFVTTRGPVAGVDWAVTYHRGTNKDQTYGRIFSKMIQECNADFKRIVLAYRGDPANSGTFDEFCSDIEALMQKACGEH